MDVAVVILNWNTRDFLASFLPPLLDSLPEGACAVVADNGSSDGSVGFLEKEYPDVRRILFSENFGFTGGYNRAISQLLEDGDAPRYVLLLNSDILVKDGWLEPLVRWMDANPEYGACGPKLHALDRDEVGYRLTDRFEYAGAAGGFLDGHGYPYCRGRVMKRTEEDRGQYGSSDVLWVSGAALMVRSSVWKALGGLDDRFFAHMEEIDLCWRIQLAGWSVDVVPASVVWHVGGGTLPNNSPWKLELNYRNNLLMLENNLAKTYAAQLYRKDPLRAARQGSAQARRVITRRMLLDGLSGLVYLLTGEWASLRAVLKAHKAYRTLRRTETPEEIAAWLPGNRAEVRGLWTKWIVLAALLQGDRIFETVHKI
ncbi:MAG: glycosyltransferase [Bacteroidales bacterium]|nr:glycosyltransferase [Bacteroidales bacterium]